LEHRLQAGQCFVKNILSKMIIAIAFIKGADLLFNNHHYCFMSVNFAFGGFDHKFNAFGISLDKEIYRGFFVY